MPTARVNLAVGVVNGVLYAVGGNDGEDGATATVEAYDPATDTWTTKPPMPTGRSSFAVGVVRGVLYAVGGWNPRVPGQHLSTVEAYDPATDAWTTKAPMPTPRSGLAVGVVNDVLYAMGGENTSWANNALATVEVYNPFTNSWTTGPPMPTPREDLAAGVLDNVLYACGGSNDRYLATTEAYDPMANTWTQKATMPTARPGLAVAEVDGALYAVGGRTSSDGLATLEAFDPARNRWTAKVPQERTGLSVGLVNGVLYAVGGISQNRYVATVESYDPTTRTWTAKASMRTARHAFGAGVVGGVLYAVGGRGPGGDLDTVEAYDPVTDAWTTKAPMPTARSGLAVGVVDGVLYAVGGYRGGRLSTVEAYDPATDIWTTKAPMPTARSALAVGVVNGILNAFGGVDDGGYLATVEAYDPAIDSWRPRAPMPTARSGSGVAAVHDVLYVVGGLDGHVFGPPLATMEAYDPRTDAWTTEPAMPTPRYALAVGGANGVLYAIGGSNRGYSVASVEAFVPNAPPTAGDVAIIGTPAVGQRLTGVYRYADADGDAEGTSKFRWLRDGIAIGAATARTYDVGPADPGRTLAFEVTPVASSGASPGVAVASAGTGFVAGKTATLAAGGLHTCAVTGSGAVWCWGNNQSGQLGDGTVPARLTPGPVSGLRTGAVTLAAGAFHTCAVTSGGILRCWGDNWHGQLGDGTTTDRLTPVPVSGLGSVVAVVAGWRHTCALTSAGEVWCWGDNSNGQLGDGTMTDRLTPVPVSGLDSGVVAVAAGSGHTCALTSAGEVSCWGYNGQAQLGDGTMTNRLTPVPVSGLDSGVVAVAAGASVTCALTDAGEAWCWGSNSNGQLGDGSVMERSTPVPVSGLENDVVAVAAGGHHACAHTSAGEVSCWGYNGEAQLGDGTTTDLLTPVPVSGLGSVVAVAAGSYQTCAQMRNGAVSCWGWNSQLGDAAMRIRLTPEPVLSLEGFFADGANDDVLGLQTRLALLNPHDVATSASLEFLTTGGSSVTHGPVSLAAQQRLTLDTWTDVPGLANTGFSTIVRSSELSVVADRTMRWDGRGAGAHAETGRTTPSSTWYLAEGATIHSFALSYHVQNPNSVPATVTVRYLLSAGAPVEKRYEVPARSGITIPVNAETVEGVSLANRELSAVLTTSPSTPVLVERSMYLAAPGEVVTGGHASAGVTAPAERWFLAEGATGPFFDLFVLVANPGDAAAQIEVTYLLPDGTTVIKPYTVAAGSRFNIWVDYEDARLADTAVALSVRSANGVPVLVERAMWWPVAAATWYEGHNSPGTTTTGTKWALAEGEVGGPREVETYLLIANPSATTGTVQVTLLFEDGTSAKRTFAVLATSRFNVDVGTEFPEARDRRFGAIVESLGPRLPTPEPIVVERSMYWNAGGKTWAAGTNALATKLQ